MHIQRRFIVQIVRGYWESVKDENVDRENLRFATGVPQYGFHSKMQNSKTVYLIFINDDFSTRKCLGKTYLSKNFAIYFIRGSRIPPFSGNLNYLHTTFLFVDGFYSNQS